MSEQAEKKLAHEAILGSLKVLLHSLEIYSKRQEDSSKFTFVHFGLLTVLEIMQNTFFPPNILVSISEELSKLLIQNSYF